MRVGPADAAGWHGKLACRGDFVGQGLPPQWLRRWDDATRRGLALAHQRWPSGLRERLLALQAWQGLVWPEQPGQPAWLALVLPSPDRVGRVWPLLVAEGHGATALAAISLGHLRARAAQLLPAIGQALGAEAPERFGQVVAQQLEQPWPLPPQGHAAQDHANLWRMNAPSAGSFWWPVAGSMPPEAEPWPPGEAWLARLLEA